MTSTTGAAALHLATNNGDISGGEVMLLAIASAARDLGVDVCVVAPTGPADVLERAAADGFEVVPVPATDRRSYLTGLRSWDQTRSGLLWCNGLVPASATLGHPDRIVALHQQPHGLQRPLRLAATAGVREVLVPSIDMGRSVRHTRVLENWTHDVERVPVRARTGPDVVGFLGRLTLDKGVDVLARALRRLLDQGRDVELVMAGETRYGRHDDAEQIADALAPLEGRVTTLGWVTPSELFARADVVACPSVWREPFGLVAAEAMAAGVPLVVSDAGALPEVVGEDHPWIARAGDAAGLASVIARVLDADDAVRASAVDGAHGRWARHWSPVAGRARLAALLARHGLETRAEAV